MREANGEKLDECSSQEEIYCQLIVFQNKHPREALREAGYSENTIRSRGVNYWDGRPRVQRRMAELRNGALAKHGGRIEDIFMSVGKYLPEALDVLAELMRDSDSDAVRQRSAATILETGKGLMIAQMPKRVTFEVRMSELALEAQRKLAAGEKIIDVTPEVPELGKKDEQ